MFSLTKPWVFAVAFLGLTLLASTQALPVTGYFLSELEVGSRGSSPSPFLALVVAQDKAMAYLCDGQSTAEWYRGPVQAGGLLELRSSSQKTRVTAQINARSVVGSITLEDGRVLPFRASRSEEANAGLYRSETEIDMPYLGGWVVLPDGQQRGAVIGGGSTRPGFRLEFAAKLIQVNLPGIGPLKPFKVTTDFVAQL